MADKKIIFDGYTRRLDVFAADSLPDLSRALVQKMIKEGHITVNGKTVKPSWPLTRGEVVEFNLPQAHAQTPLKDLLIHDAKDFFVVIKPAGLLVHPQSPIWEEHPETVGQTCKIQTCYSNTNKRVVAIGNSIRNQVFKACIGKKLFDAETQKGGIDTTKLYGLQFQCYVDVKQTAFGFNAEKNNFKSFKCIYDEEQLLEIAKTRFPV